MGLFEFLYHALLISVELGSSVDDYLRVADNQLVKKRMCDSENPIFFNDCKKMLVVEFCRGKNVFKYEK